MKRKSYKDKSKSPGTCSCFLEMFNLSLQIITSYFAFQCTICYSTIHCNGWSSWNGWRGQWCSLPGTAEKMFCGTTVAKQTLGEFLDKLSGRNQRPCLLFFSSGRTMFLFIDSHGHSYFMDSHSHRDCGAEWIDRMMDLNWQTPLTLGWVTEVMSA